MKKSVSLSPFHARNRHQGEYDFAALTAAHPPLAAKVRPNGYGVQSVDFADPEAVMLLNQALIKLFYGLDWQLAPGSLCPRCRGVPITCIILLICWRWIITATFPWLTCWILVAARTASIR